MPYKDLEKKRIFNRRWIEQNHDKKRACDRKYRKENLDKVRAVSREASRKYYIQNRDKVITRQQIRREIPQVKLASNLRARLRLALRNDQKTGSAVKDLGCSIVEFKLYIESQFDEYMTWDNYGEVWELDHVMPLCEFDLTNRMEFLEACNWLNIRPMFVSDNRSRLKKVLNFQVDRLKYN